MIESYCRANIWEKCKGVTGEPQFVWLKGKPKPAYEFEDFYKNDNGFSIIFDVKSARRQTRDEVYRKAVFYMGKNGAKICQSWIDKKYGGDWLTAIRAHDTFNSLFIGFEEFFRERRKLFMDNVVAEIHKMFPSENKELLKRPGSHGGVANLLKILTRTMNEQGASIENIAKMQFCVCTQAGIYIPDEFITDVFTAVNIKNIEGGTF